jgi:hypothetical protein
MPRRVKLPTYLMAMLAPCVVTMAGPAAVADEVFSATAQVAIPGAAMKSWDISFVDPTLGQFFLGDRTHKAVDVIDTGTNTFVAFIADPSQPFAGVVSPCSRGGSPGANDCNGPNGVLTTNNSELWVSDGDSTVKVFDLTQPGFPRTHTISTNGRYRGDEMCFDREQRFVMVANNSQADHNTALNSDGPFATIISVKTHTIVKQIAFDGTKGAPKSFNGAEQCSWSSRTERFYITIPGVNPPDGGDGTGVVAVINPEDLDDKKLVEKVFPLANTDCDTPQGSAVGPDHQLLIGCNGSTHSTNAVILDDRDGTILARVANESGPDEVWYNPGDGQYFLARSSAPGPQQLLGVIDARGFQADQSVFTAGKSVPPAPALPASHSVAADPVKNQVYVAIGGGASTLCGQNGGSDSQGCIAVFTTTNDDQCLAEGAPVRQANAREDLVFMRGKCRDLDNHDRDDHRDDR